MPGVPFEVSYVSKLRCRYFFFHGAGMYVTPLTIEFHRPIYSERSLVNNHSRIDQPQVCLSSSFKLHIRAVQSSDPATTSVLSVQISMQASVDEWLSNFYFFTVLVSTGFDNLSAVNSDN